MYTPVVLYTVLIFYPYSQICRQIIAILYINSCTVIIANFKMIQSCKSKKHHWLERLCAIIHMSKLELLRCVRPVHNYSIKQYLVPSNSLCRSFKNKCCTFAVKLSIIRHLLKNCLQVSKSQLKFFSTFSPLPTIT